MKQLRKDPQSFNVYTDIYRVTFYIRYTKINRLHVSLKMCRDTYAIANKGMILATTKYMSMCKKNRFSILFTIVNVQYHLLLGDNK